VHDGIWRTVTYALFRTADQNEDGEVRLQDVTSLVKGLGDDGEKRLQEMFEAADKDGSKTLSKKEVAQAVQKWEQLGKEAQASGQGKNEAGRELFTSLLARAGGKGKAASLDQTIYCKRGHYWHGGPGPYGYLMQESTSAEDVEANDVAEVKSITSHAADSSDEEGNRELIAGLISRAADQGQDAATTLDKGYHCKIVHDGIWRTVTYALFRTADQNGDGEVKLQDVTALADGLGEHGEKRLKDMFEAADEDGSKTLSKDEVVRAVQKLGQLHSEGEAVGEEEGAAGRKLLTSLLARTGDASKAVSLEQTIYCKHNRRFYVPGPFDGPYR